MLRSSLVVGFRLELTLFDAPERHAADAALVPRVMPGAAQAVEAVRAEGGRVAVVTSRQQGPTRASLDDIGMPVDEVVGDLASGAEGPALRARSVQVYVGNNIGDVAAARAGGAVGVAVSTGSFSPADLQAAGADVVLPSLQTWPEWLADHLLGRRLADLDARLRGLGSVLIAFSGGVDSAFLLAAAVRALGTSQVAAATAVSPSLTGAEVAAAAEFAAALGVGHEKPHTSELTREGYRLNGGDRCFFCKAELIDVLGPLAGRLGLAHIATGTNADDVVAGFRPGIRAAAERAAVTPLADAGLHKAHIREASRRWGLRTWDKPAAACLSSRMAYGVPITVARLGRVERAEAGLRTALATAGLHSRDLRVRDLGDRARIEVDPDIIGALAARPDVLRAVEGFGAVEVDPRGFRSGSMNELLPDSARYADPASP